MVAPAFLLGVTTVAGWGLGSTDYEKPAAVVADRDSFLFAPQDPDGEKLYEDECSFCHGDEGRGDGQLGRDMNPRPPDISDPAYLDETPDEEIIRVIAEGAGDMGAYEEFFVEPAMKAIVEYMRQLGEERRKSEEEAAEKEIPDREAGVDEH